MWFGQKINKIIISILMVSFLVMPFFVTRNTANATSGACSWHGGVNCSAGADWDGSVICYDGWRGSSVSYNSMVKCNNYGSSYNSYSLPSYNSYSLPSSYYSTPTCPLNSLYSYLDDTCKCNYGYIADGDKCISGNSYCWNKYGYNSDYNSLNKTCECGYGYLMDNGRCISEDTYCSNLMGYRSKYNFLYDRCECDYGYVYYNNKCTDEDSYCEDVLGDNSRYNSLYDKCECDYGYTSNGYNCVKKESYSYPTPKISLPTCPTNSYPSLTDTTKCTCNYGYQANQNKTGCILIPAPIIKDPVVLGESDTKSQTELNLLNTNNPLGLQAEMLIKNKKFAETFYVNEDLCLRWIINEQVAEKYFGDFWWQKIVEYEEIPQPYKFCDNFD